MARIVDNLIAYKVLSMIVKPFIETDAYKLGVIDKDGKNLIKTSKLDSKQKEAYTYLTRLVFNIKKILNRLPGGDNKTKNLVAALWLVKECYENNKDVPLVEDVEKLLKTLETVTLVEEEILVNKFMQEDGGGGVAAMGAGAPTNIGNIAGIGVSTDQTVARKKDIDKYKKNNAGAISLARRGKVVQ